MQNYNKKTLFFIIITLIWLDQVSKYLFYDLKFLNENYFINDILNTWISWWIKVFHFNILIVLIPLILFTLIFLRKKKEISNGAFMLIFAWGLGNYIDRIIYFGVRDFIDFHFFPIFNLADIFVSLGFGILVWWIFKQIFLKQNN